MRSGWIIGVLCACGAAAAEGVDFEFRYTADVLRNASGGLDSGTRYLDNLDLTLGIDVAEAWGFGSGSFFFYGLYNNHETFSDELAGDLQVVSNIDAPGAARLYEAWYEVGEGRSSLRAGLYDLNSEFDVNESGEPFLHSSHGVGAELGQTGANGPSIFPVTSLGLRYAYESEAVEFRGAVLDGVPGDPNDPASNEIDLGGDDGVLLAAEAVLPFGESGRVWGGYWRYSEDAEPVAGAGSAQGNDGAYVGVESRVSIGRRELAWFVRYGGADATFNPLETYLGTGVVLHDPFRRRNEDRLGIAVATAWAGAAYRDLLASSGSGAKRTEMAWELTYRAHLTGWLALQPDVQFVRSPSAFRSIDDAWVFGLRLSIGFARSF